MAVLALGLSPVSLKTMGPVDTESPPGKFVFLMAATIASGSVEAARYSTSAITWMAS